MRKSLARKRQVKRNISIQYAVHGVCKGAHQDVLDRAFSQALSDRVAEVLALEVKKIMDIEPSVEDLDIRTY